MHICTLIKFVMLRQFCKLHHIPRIHTTQIILKGMAIILIELGAFVFAFFSSGQNSDIFHNKNIA